MPSNAAGAADDDLDFSEAVPGELDGRYVRTRPPERSLQAQVCSRDTHVRYGLPNMSVKLKPNSHFDGPRLPGRVLMQGPAPLRGDSSPRLASISPAPPVGSFVLAPAQAASSARVFEADATEGPGAALLAASAATNPWGSVKEEAGDRLAGGGARGGGPLVGRPLPPVPTLGSTPPSSVARSRQPFEGLWVATNTSTTHTILWNRIILTDGSVADINVVSHDSFTVELGSELVRATIVEGHLEWSNGQVWIPVEGASCMSTPTPSSMQEAKLAAAHPLSVEAAAEIDKLFEGVPGDDNGRPRPPHPARTTQGLLFGTEEEITPMAQQAMREEEQWLERKRLTGAVGRLVRYREGQHPSNDVLGLRLTKHGRITVTALQQDGPAVRAGVCTGDQLASIDGRRPVISGPPNTLLQTLRPPVTLVFLGFAGKLQAEVRVRQPDQPLCGIPADSEIVCHQAGHATPPLRVTEAIMFGKPNASIFIATDSARSPHGEEPLQDMRQALAAPLHTQSAEHGGGDGDAPATESLGEQGLYELQREDARRLLKRALKAGTPKGTLCTV